MSDLFVIGFFAGLALAIPVGPMAIMLINTTLEKGWRTGVAGASAMPRDALSEASIALQQLGYKPAEISRMVKDSVATDSAEDIIRAALKSALRS